MNPGAANVFLGGTQTFTATVTGGTGGGVTWDVNGVGGGNATIGTINSAGMYTAPAVLPEQTSVTVGATSTADPSKRSTATVTVASDVAVTVSPTNTLAELGAQRQFTANVTGSGNPSRNVVWGVGGVAGGNATVGTIDANGLFTAPQALPNPAEVKVAATSVADPGKKAEATLTATSTFTIAASGPADVQTGLTAQFTATITPVAGSNPSRAVRWMVNGLSGGGAAVGTIDTGGLYTAPVQEPADNPVTVTAVSLADAAKSATTQIQVQGVLAVLISPSSAPVELERTQQFSAVVTGTFNQNVSWEVEGVLGGNNTVGTITNTLTNPGLYTAPKNLPAINPVTVTARSRANPTVFASVPVTLFSTIVVQLSPTGVTLAVGRKQRFVATVQNSTNQTVTWSVNGVPGGNAEVGRICVADFNPCEVLTQTTLLAVDYVAPAQIPNPETVTLTARSQADPSKATSSPITISSALQVIVTPGSIILGPSSTQQFSAQVLGAANQNVTWTVTGPSCGAGGCGSVTPTGLYTAPLEPPSPNQITITAISAEDSEARGTASVIIATGPILRRLLPASAFAGGAAGFTLKARGTNFIVGAAGAGSTLLVGGMEKTTNCVSTTECTVALTAADIASTGDVPVQVKNPGLTPQTSNIAALRLLTHTSAAGTISLTGTAPTATGRDIAVVDMTTTGLNGSSPDSDLDIAAIGRVVGVTCEISGGALALARPSTGSLPVEIEICVFGTGITAERTFRISGPATGDIAIVQVTTVAIGVVLRLSVPATAKPGPRTLFVENQNKDQAAATAALEVK